MMKKPQSEWRIDSPNVLGLILNNWLLLGTVSLAAFLLAAIVSLTITPKFRSTVILYPVQGGSFSSELFHLAFSNQDLMQFGDEESTEKLIQILSSREAMEHLIDRFGLYQHYEIDPESKYPETQAIRQLRSRVDIRKTEYQSVKVEVLDTDPEVAAAMVKALAGFADRAYATILRHRVEKGYELIEEEYLSEKALLSAYEDSLDWLADKGIVTLAGQAEGLYRAYAAAIQQNNAKLSGKLERELNALIKYGSVYTRVNKHYDMVANRYATLREKFGQIKADMEMELPNVLLVSDAKIPEKKATPKRSVIVLAVTFTTFLMSLLILIVLQSVKRTRN